MNQVLTEELLEDPWIARVEVSHNKRALCRVQILRKKDFNGLRIFRVVKFLGDRLTCNAVQQGQAEFLCPAPLRMLLVVENNLNIFYGRNSDFIN
jgi:hypothetical protein